jgi:hypothetical protein
MATKCVCADKHPAESVLAGVLIAFTERRPMTWKELGEIGLDRALALQGVGKAVSMCNYRFLIDAAGVRMTEAAASESPKQRPRAFPAASGSQGNRRSTPVGRNLGKGRVFRGE